MEPSRSGHELAPERRSSELDLSKRPVAYEAGRLA